MRSYKIKPGVKPYANRILEASREDVDTVTGYVRLSKQRTATAARTYRRDELEARQDSSVG